MDFIDALFDLSSVGLSISNKNGVIEKANKHYCEILGYTEEEIVGQHISHHVFPEHGHSINALYQSSLENEQKKIHTFKIKDKQGKTKIIELEGRNFKSSNGDLKKLNFIIDQTPSNGQIAHLVDKNQTPSVSRLELESDHSERNKENKELTRMLHRQIIENEDRLNSILNSIDEAVFSLKKGLSELLYANQATSSILGLLPEDLYSDTFDFKQEFFNYLDIDLNSLFQAILNNDTFSSITHFSKKPQIIKIDLKVWAVKDVKGEIQRIDGVFRDVTRQSANEERIQQLLKESQEINRILQDNEMVLSKSLQEMRESQDSLLQITNQLQEAQEIGKIGYWEYDIGVDMLIWSQEVYHIFELSTDEEPPFLPDQKRYFSDDQFMRYEGLIREALQSDENITAEFEILTENNNTKFIAIRARKAEELKGTLSVRGTIQDITENKLQQEEIYYSSTLLTKIFEESEDALLLLDQHSKQVIRANPSVYDLFEIDTHKEIEGTDGRYYYLSKLSDLEAAHVTVFLTERKTWNKEIKFETELGNQFWGAVSVKLFNIKDHAFELVRISDITQKIESEIQITRNKNLLSDAQKVGKIASFEWNIDTNSMFWSDQFNVILGKIDQNSNYSFYNFVSYFHSDDIPDFLDEIEKVKSGKTSLEYQFRYHLHSNEVKHFYIKAELEQSSTDGQRLLVGLIQDISLQKQNEKELIKAKLEAEQLADTKQEFLAVMSHEIRTPINAISGLADIAIKRNKDSELSDHLKMLHFSSQQLTTLINDILDFSKIEAGGIKLEKAVFNLNDFLSHIVEIHRYKAEEKNLDLQLRLDSKAPLYLIGDSLRLSQVINNLLSNAIKFTNEGFVRLSIKYQSTVNNQCQILFQVEDTGIGISEENQQLIFDKFSQAEIDTSRRYGGTGLGLAISKQLVELHGSRLELKSKKHEGSIFSFQMKFDVPSHQEIDRLENNAENHLSGFENHQIMVVEDNRINQIVIENIFSEWGIEPVIVKNGEDAFKEFKSTTFDLVLMDLRMPIMDGYETTRLIRAYEKENGQKLTPIVALTADESNQVLKPVMEVGMNDILTKPFHIDDLKNILIRYTQSSEIEQKATTKNFQYISPQLLKKITKNSEKYYRSLLNELLISIPKYKLELVDESILEDREKVVNIEHKLKTVTSLLKLTDLQEAFLQLKSDNYMVRENAQKNVITILNLILVDLKKINSRN